MLYSYRHYLNAFNIIRCVIAVHRVSFAEDFSTDYLPVVTDQDKDCALILSLSVIMQTVRESKQTLCIE